MIQFCQSEGIPTSGLKSDLNARILLFLETGDIQEVRQYRPRGKPDSEIGLHVDMPVQHYKSDPKTRAFFKAHIPEFTGFSAKVQQWVKMRLAAHEQFTYRDIIEAHKVYLEDKKNALAEGKALKVAHDSCQYNQFQIDYAQDTAIKVHGVRAAWQLVRNSAGDKTYARYKERMEKIKTAVLKYSD